MDIEISHGKIQCTLIFPMGNLKWAGLGLGLGLGMDDVIDHGGYLRFLCPYKVIDFPCIRNLK